MTNRKRLEVILCGAALAALTSFGCDASLESADDDAPPQTPNDPPDTTPEGSAGGQLRPAPYARDSVIVRFRTPRSSASLESATARVNGSIEDLDGDGIYDRFRHLANGQLAVVRLNGTADVDGAIATLRQDPDVLYAERNHFLRALATPDDPRFPELYGLNNIGQTGGTPGADIDAPEAWDDSVGSSDVVVAVIDTGVDHTHEDLAANMWTNPGEIPGNGQDDDGNGVIDDVHGFNAIDGSGNPFDDHSHGTHCAGTIGAVGDNGVGVAGVNWAVQIMAIKFLDAGGFGTTEDAISAIDYAVAERNAGVNLRILSNSWGGGEFSQALLDAIEAANQAGMLFVAAAGNDFGSNNDVFPQYPSSYEAANVVAVAATTHNDDLALFSNIGPTSVDLGAPGEDILSTVPGNRYDFFSGTSMATPHVAGVGALALSANDTLSADELKDILVNSGDPIPALDGVTVSGRRLNAAAALEQVGPPVPRFGMSVTPFSQMVTQEEIATYTVDVSSLAGFAGDVALRVAADPPIDATLTITPNVTAPGTGTLDVATTTATASGLYTLVVTGQSGDLTRSHTVFLRVRAPGDPLFGLTISPPSQAIPPNEFAGYAITVQSLGFAGDVSLSLTSEPEFSGFVELFPNPVSSPGLSGLSVITDCSTTPGAYTFTVTGTDGSDTDSATAQLTVLSSDTRPPFAEFFYDQSALTFQFADFSFSPVCGGTEIVAWAWDFGDGTTSDEQEPLHVYATPGDYLVTLTVTDSNGLSDSTSQLVTATRPPPVLSLLRVTRNPAKFQFRVDLRWKGAEGDLVDLFRNFERVDSPDNDGVYRDVFRTHETSFVWFICEQQSSFCSNQVRVQFGPNLMQEDQATVTMFIHGREIVRRVRIEEELD